MARIGDADPLELLALSNLDGSTPAVSAAKLTTGRTLSITGDIAYTSPSFDGSANVTAAGTLATVNGNVGSFTYASITVNAKGLITAAASGAAPVSSANPTASVGPSAVNGSATTYMRSDAAPALANTAVTPGSYTATNLTVDAQGRITAASNGSGGSGTVTSVTSATGDITVATGTTTPVLTSVSAPKWSTPRVLSFTGDVTGSGSVDGSAAVATALTIASSVALAGNPTTTTQATTDNSTRIATTAYTTTAIANAVAGVNPAVAVQAATTAAGDTSAYVYNNGVAGIGATLTGPTANVAVTVDGFTFTTLGQRLLVKNDTQSPSGAFNGVYYVTTLQGIAIKPVLTRALDYDMPSDINNTGAIPVVNGTVNALTSWLLTSSVATVGTDPLTYTEFSATPTGAALSVLGVAGNASAIRADIAAASDGQVLRRSGTAVAFGAVDLAGANAVTGNLATSHLNSGASASSSTFWRGDGTWAAVGAIITTAVLAEPQGRLTLVTAVPVMVSDQTAKTHVYYTPYIGPNVPIYDGSNWGFQTLSADLDMALDTTNQLSGSLYDLFVYAGPTIGAGPAWSSSTARGTGAGTTELQMLNGIWTNKNSITLKNGAGAGTSVAANRATYLGTAYMTANGQTGMAYLPTHATGGTNNFLGLYNAYNRVPTTAMCRDSTASWTDSTTAYHATNASNSNRISVVDGLAQSEIFGVYTQAVSGNNEGQIIGMALNSTSATPQAIAAAWTLTAVTARDRWAPSLGLNFIQEVSIGRGSGAGSTPTFFGAQSYGDLNSMSVTLEM